MKTVQLAIPDSEYTQALRSLLLCDATHSVCLVEHPDLRLDGVIVIAADNLENLSLLESDPERFVVITRNGTDLSRIWEAGARHVVFEKDSPNTAQLAIIAAELRLLTEFIPPYPHSPEPVHTLNRLPS